MNAEVISFKSKDTSAKDLEVIETFLEGIQPIESYNFFYLDATRSATNTTLEVVTWENAIDDLRKSVIDGIKASPKEKITEFMTMVNGVNAMPPGGLGGVAFSCHIGPNIMVNWSFMLCKKDDGQYIIRDLIRNGKRVLVRA